MFNEAIEQLTIVWEITEAKYGLKSEQSASILVELADAYDKKTEYKEAVDYQKRALDIYKELNLEDKSIVASISMKLGEIYDRAERLDEAIDVLREVISIYKHRQKKFIQPTLVK